MNTSPIQISNDNKMVINRVKFIILFVLLIPSMIIYVFIFIYFIKHRSLLKTLQNQALFILIPVNFLQASCNLPLAIHFYYFGRVKPSTSAYCTWWTFFQYTLSVSNEFLMATISIQRHILIFNSHLLHIRIKRFFLYYFPLVLCIIYPMFFYLSLVVIYPCDGTQWDFTLNLCGLANCFLVYNRILATVDWAIDSGLPLIVITIANMSLVIRVVRQKHRHQQMISWQKQRHMTLQLLSISCLYMIAWFPNTIFAIIYHITESNVIARIHSNYMGLASLAGGPSFIFTLQLLFIITNI